MSAWIIVLLVAQAGLALFGLGALGRRAYPALARHALPAVITDVWAPLLIVLPLLSVVGRVETTVIGQGWLPLGGPIVAGALGAGLAIARAAGRKEDRSLGISPVALLCWGGAGLVVVLLGAAHELTIWVGQCTFALAAVILWMNVPHPSVAAGVTITPETSTAHRAMAVVALCSIGQTVIGCWTAAEAPLAAGVISVGFAAAAVTWAVVAAPPPAALAIAGWTAAIGVLLGIGSLSMFRLVPQAIAVAAEPTTAVTSHVAFGFGRYAPEGMTLLLVPAVLWAAARSPRAVRVALGGALATIAVVLLVWRIRGL